MGKLSGDSGAPQERGRLDGRVAIVTGAAQGLGACVAQTLAAEGASLMLADVQEEKVAAVAQRLRDAGAVAESVHVDVADRELAQAMVATTLERFGRIDALVLAGAIDGPPGRAWEIDAAHWRRIVDVDLTGQWWCAEAAMPSMIERGSGRIVFVSSLSGRLGHARLSPAYAAAKAGLFGLTVALAVQLEPHGILVNAIAPGAIGTGTPMHPDDEAAYRERFPLGIGGPRPVADAVTYLLASSGDWISGVVMNVSGGKLRGGP
jgi:3-oxoacyl-[acyl-carrier protein] reductase